MANITGIQTTGVDLPDIATPPNPTTIADRLVERIDSMREEAVGPMYAGATARGQLRMMASNSPADFVFGSDVHCSGAGVSTTNVIDVDSYWLETTTGSKTPQEHIDQTGTRPTYKASKTSGVVEDVMQIVPGETTGPEGTGRARGINGWDDLGNMIGGTLASFAHNFQALLLGYGKLPSLPSYEPWQLPNLVEDPEVVNRERSYNASIQFPKNFAPSAAYTYQLPLPSPVIYLLVNTKTDGGATGVVEFWDSNDDVLARTQELDFPDGAHQTIISLEGNPLGMSSGRVNLNPGDAPNGLTVQGIDIFPPTL
jgi:hypothetical protein